MRARGEGSISRDGERYVAQLSYTDSAGKRHRPKRRARTRREAAVLLEELRRERDGGTRARVATSRETVERYLARWLTLSVEPVLRPRTVRAYQDQVRLHIVPAIGHLLLQRLVTDHVQAMLNALRAAGLSAASVDKARRVLHTALRHAVETRLLAVNPVDATRPPRGPRREPRALSAAEVAQLLERTADSRYASLYRVTVAIGLRESEALGLRWVDVESPEAHGQANRTAGYDPTLPTSLEARPASRPTGTQILHVRGQLGMLDGRLQHVPTKTAAGSRVIALPQIAARALRDRAVQQAFDAARAGALWEDHGFVFTTQRGRPLRARNVYRVFKRDVAAAGFPALTFHDLRHTAISLMAAGGVHQRVVMQIVGHTRSSLTTDIYTHADADMQRSAAEAIDAAMGGER